MKWQFWSRRSEATVGTTVQTAIPDILAETEEGFADLVFAVVRERRTANGGWSFFLRASHEGETVGLEIEFSAEWQSRDTSGIPCYAGIVTYRSAGAESDRLLVLLDRLYETNLRPAHMVNSVSFAALTLGDDPKAMDSTVVHTKLFHEPDEENFYAEVYTNIDLPRGLVQIREKDNSYRRTLVLVLSRTAE